MKKIYSILLLLLTLTITLHAQWTELGTATHALGAHSYIYGVVSDAAGNVYAAGSFTNGGGQQYVAKWNGTNWAELGSGANALNANGDIKALAIDPLGNIYAGGYFYDVPSNTWYVAKWNGSSWSQLGSLGAGSYIFAITTDAAGNVYAAGQFTDANHKFYVAKWDGSAWHTLGTGTRALNANDHINSLAVDASGNVYAGGYFTNGSGKSYVAKYSPVDTAWHELAGSHALNSQTSYDYIYSLITDASGNIYAAGGFANSSGDQYVAQWNGSDWSELGAGTNALHANDFIYTLTKDGSGNIYAAGRFTDPVGSPYVAKWNGTSWSEVTKNTDSLHANDYIYSLTTAHDGSLLAGGYFTDTSGYQYVARFASGTTGLEDVQSSLTGVSIYPNPSNGLVAININKQSLIDADISVTDMIGKTIISDGLTSYHHLLDLTQSPKGMYLVTIENDAERLMRKIVIE